MENSDFLKSSSLQNLDKPNASSKGQANPVRRMDSKEDSREFCALVVGRKNRRKSLMTVSLTTLLISVVKDKGRIVGTK